MHSYLSSTSSSIDADERLLASRNQNYVQTNYRYRYATQNMCADTNSANPSAVFPDLIAHVYDRCKENDDFIDHITSRSKTPGATITQLRSSCAAVDGALGLTTRESAETVDVGTFVAAWRPADTEYIDTTADFPSAIHWNLDSFNKLVHANGFARIMATSLGIVEGSLNSKQVLVKLLRNVTKIGDQLRQLDLLTGGYTHTAAAAVNNTAASCMSLRDESESAANGVSRKHGVVANTTAEAVATVTEADTTMYMPTKAVSAGLCDALSALGVLAEHRAFLLQWISEARGAPYTGDTLTLQYQASRDGWKGDDFRRMCNGQGSMVFIVRSDKGYLFGGYTSVGFTQYIPPFGGNIATKLGTGARDDTAFVFTLTNPHGIAPAKYPCKRPDMALNNYASGHGIGLCFYNGFALGPDCNVKADRIVIFLTPDSYDTPHGNKTFTGLGRGWTVLEALGFRV